jgi:Holliday junction resolvase RusA-like endonuclease
MTPLVIRLAGQPQGKARPRFARANGRAFTPAHTRAYEAALRYAAQEAMGDRSPMLGPLAVTVEAVMPIPASASKKFRAAALAGLERPTKKPDWDNFAKALDAFNEVVWRDDAQVVEGLVVKRYGEMPGLTITVASMEAA